MILKGGYGEILEINILRRSSPYTNDYWDGNWLECEVKINVSGFKALYGINLRVDELQIFYKELSNLQSRAVEEAEFTTMEEGLYLHFASELTGIVMCKGKASNQTGNSLEFTLQVYLPEIDAFSDDVKSILKSYPLIGSIE